MAKNQPDKLEPLETETLYFIEQKEDFPFRGQWVIYTQTKYGKKMFNYFQTKEIAENAAKYFDLKMVEAG
jgi:hypothetical protein|nr:MAG: hypothetical protein [Caudoviricetes sp.]